MNNSHPVILYAEDEQSDVLLFEWALGKAGVPHQLFNVRNGDEAVAYLSGTGKYVERQKYPMPALLILDLHLPRRSGLKVLEWIHTQAHLAGLPVVIWTSSENPDDFQQATKLGVSEFVVKPTNFEETVKALRRVTGRWLGR